MIADRVTRGWVVVAVSVPAIAVSFGSLVVFTFGVFLKPLSAALGASRGEISFAFTLAALAIAVSSPVIGRMVDRAGVRKVLFPSVAVYGAAFCGLAFANTLAALYAVYLLLGSVGNGTTQLCYARVISAWFDRRRGIAMAIMMAGTAAGAITIPPLATYLLNAFGRRETCLIFGAAIFVLGLLPPALFLREAPPGRAAARERERPSSAEVKTREAARTQTFWLLLAGFFLFSVSVNGAIAHLIPLLTDRGIASATAAAAASALGALTLAGRLLTGVLLDRYPGSRVAAAFFAIAACGVAMLSQARGIAPSFIAAGLIGLGMGAEADVMPFLISRYFGLSSFSEIYGYAFTAYALAAACGPLAMGWSFDRVHSYTGSLLVLSVLMLTGAAALAILPRYNQSGTRVESFGAVAR